MRTSSLRRPLALALCALVLALAFLTTLLEATHAAHDCPTADCIVCAVADTARGLLRQLLLAATGALLLLALSLAGTWVPGRATRRLKAATPVSLKTRLNP